MFSLKLIKSVFRNNKTKKKLFIFLKKIKKQQYTAKKYVLLIKLKQKINKNIFRCISIKKKVYLLKYIRVIQEKILKYKKRKFIHLSKKMNKFFIKKKNYQDGTLLYKKLLGVMTKRGLKIKSFNILQVALHLASLKTNTTPSNILTTLYKKLKTFVEPKTIKKRKRNYIVPFPITKKRSFYLVAKWILNSVKKKKTKNIEKVLAKEITNIVLKKKSTALKLKKINISTSLRNKSNLHFRW